MLVLHNLDRYNFYIYRHTKLFLAMPNCDDSQRLPNTVLSAWQHTTDTATRMLVLPDGCRDFIIRSNPQDFSLHMLSPLDDSARYVESDRGDSYFGWRLHPAASFNQAHARSTKLTERLNELTTQFPIDPQHLQHKSCKYWMTCSTLTPKLGML